MIRFREVARPRPSVHRSARHRPRSRPCAEALESRALLAMVGPAPASMDVPAPTPDSVVVLPALQASPAITNSTPTGLSPSQVRAAYGFSQINGDGTGQTIAIVDAYNDPNLSSDLASFSSHYGLPQANLTIVNQTGGKRLPMTSSGWALEISLDVEWAHAIAPGAKLLVIEASSSSFSNLLAAVNYARSQAGVSVVSMSWGAGEFSGESSDDSDFTTPSGHQGITFVASSGDGVYTSYPAVSPNVLGVGGTTLSLNSSGAYGSESAWSSTGSGYGAYESLPTYQSQTTYNYPTTVPAGANPNNSRLSPDVAYDGDPNTGMSVYDTVNYNGQSGWFTVGGTSAGAPQWAGLIAIADQGRVAAGHTTLDGRTQTLPTLYQLASTASYTSDFHDVQAGATNYNAGVGYDLASGLGSPQANNLIPALISSTTTLAAATATPATVSSGTTNPAATSIPTISASPPFALAGAQAQQFPAGTPGSAAPGQDLPMGLVVTLAPSDGSAAPASSASSLVNAAEAVLGPSTHDRRH